MFGIFKKLSTRLLDRSRSAISAFTRVAADLAAINLEIIKEQEALAAKMAKLAAENAQLQAAVEENEAIIYRINQFVGNLPVETSPIRTEFPENNQPE